MLKTILTMVVIFFIFSVTPSSHASDETFHDEELRLRIENFSSTANGVNPPGINTSTDDLTARLRIAVHDIPPGNFNFRVEGQFTDISLPADSKIFQFTNNMSQESNQIVSSFYQAWAQYVSSQWRLKVGIQELEFGRSRLIGNADWSILARSFDAARFDYFLGLTSISVFYALINSNSGGLNSFVYSNDFPGVYITFRDSFFDQIDIYAFQNSNQLLTGKGSTTDPVISLASYGARLEKKTSNLFAEGEITFQSNSGANSLESSSYQYDLEAGPSFDLFEGLLVTGEFAFASRDFNPLVPSPHGFFGAMDFFSRRNIQDMSAHLTQNFEYNFHLSLDYHYLNVVDNSRTAFNLAGTAPVAGSKAYSDLGQEIDLAVGRKWRYFVTNLGLSVFMPGESLSQSGTASPVVYYGWLSLQASL